MLLKTTTLSGLKTNFPKILNVLFKQFATTKSESVTNRLPVETIVALLLEKVCHLKTKNTVTHLAFLKRISLWFLQKG